MLICFGLVFKTSDHVQVDHVINLLLFFFVACVRACVCVCFKDLQGGAEHCFCHCAFIFK